MADLADEISVMVDCSEYNLARLKECGDAAKQVQAGSNAEFEIRAKAEAYAGLLKQSIERFEQLFADQAFRTGWNLNKYGQTLLRRGNDADVQLAESVFDEVLKRENEQAGEKWFAQHNIGLCRAIVGDQKGAVDALRAAIAMKEGDDRSEFALNIVESGAKDKNWALFRGGGIVSIAAPMENSAGTLKKMI